MEVSTEEAEGRTVKVKASSTVKGEHVSRTGEEVEGSKDEV